MRKFYISFLTVLILLSAANKTSAQCFQNFDGVVAPVLPVGWTAVTNTSGGGTTAWATSTAFSFSASNAAFTNNATDISDEWLNSEPFNITSATATLTFRNRFDLENSFDGMVLEISIGGGAFQDILLAGGSFVTGGYTGTISSSFGNPIGGRQAWTGTSSGFVLTTVNLPAAANGQNIVLRWRRSTDDSFGNTGVFIDNVVICGSACASTPPSTTNPASVTTCAGANTSFTVVGGGTNISYQWQVNTGSGFGNISNGGIYAGATTSTLSITGIPFSLNAAQYRVVVSGLCTSVNSAAATLTLTQILHSNAIATPSVMCAPGSTLITATAVGGTGTYTHTLTGGSGTIVQNPPTGINNANASFSVTAIPAGSQNYTLTSTDASGCTAVSTILVTINPIPVITFSPAAPVICNGQIQPISATVAPPIPQAVTGGSAITINAVGNATPYSSNIIVGGLPTTGVTIKSVTINGLTHTFPSDIDMVLQSPFGTNVILISDAGGSTAITGRSITLDDAAAGSVPSPIVNGTYKPTNTAGPDNFPVPGPGSITQVSPTLASFGAGDYNGAWKLFVVDDAGGDAGSISDWSITFNIPVPVVYSPVTNLFIDAAATVPYIAGTPVFGSVYAKPTATSTYTATATRNGCTGTANVTVTVNQLPTITTQPSPAIQTVCPGATVVYRVTATGAGLTYQWRKGGVALVDGVQGSGSSVAGATTNNVTLTGVVVADAGNYDVVVSGTCTPAATSTASALVIATPPTIGTQPASVTICEGASTSFSVVGAGVPAPLLYQWQVSTTAVPAFTNIVVGSFASPTFTISNASLAISGNKYRVIVTNGCGQSVTSNGLATLTVNAKPIVTATALPARICLSDGPVALIGSPVGGTWSGVGVSGSNFVPSSTAPGNYTLTYTYTNSLGCPASTTVIAVVVGDAECGRIRLLSDNALILYPNPNNGNFNIRINSILYNYLNMKVYNAAGTLVNTRNYTGLVYGQVVPINLTHLPSGAYMVRFFYDDGNRTSEKVFPVVIGRQ